MSYTRNLHSENFDLCRICLLEPESHKHIQFINIFEPNYEGTALNKQISELLGIEVEKNDIRPKIICENCHRSLLNLTEMKKKASESDIIIDYIAKKKFDGVTRSVTAPGTSNESNNSLLDSRNKKKSTNESSSSNRSHHSFHYQSTSQQSNSTSLNVCRSSNDNQGDSSQSFITSHLKSASVSDSESDDCIVVDNPVELIEISDNEESVKFNFKNKSTTKLECKKRIKKKIPRASKHVLFTCLKPDCNQIFQKFLVFKSHYRFHFSYRNKLMCWQCCLPFSNASDLRTHQSKPDCRTPGMFKCYECIEKFNDLQSLSIHKLTFHDGDLIISKINNKTIPCAFCFMAIPIFKFKSHLFASHFNEVKVT